MNGRATQMAGGLEEEGRVVVRAAAVEEVAARNGDAQQTSPAGVDRKNVECVSPWASDVLSFASHPVPARRKSRRQRRGVPRRRETPPNAKGGEKQQRWGGAAWRSRGARWVLCEVGEVVNNGGSTGVVEEQPEGRRGEQTAEESGRVGGGLVGGRASG